MDLSVHVRVPGKVMLAGEYAVLRGSPCLAFTVDRYLDVRARRTSTGTIVIYSNLWPAPLAIPIADLEQDVFPNLESFPPNQRFVLAVLGQGARMFSVPSYIRITSTLDPSFGMGSSSAVGLGILLALAALQNQDDPWACARGVHEVQRQIQSLASGYDVATQLTGGLVEFTPNQESGLTPQTVRSLDISPWFHELVHIYVGGKGAPTGQVAQSTVTWLDACDRWNELEAASQHLITLLLALQNGTLREWTQLTEIVRQQRNIFSGGPHFPTALFQTLAQLPGADQSWSFKTTGAGGEDALLLFGTKSTIAAADAVLQRWGWTRFSGSIVNKGVQVTVRCGDKQTRRRFKATAPTNIAFLKYWGKRDETQQWPANDSLSMTLSSLVTETTAVTNMNDTHRIFVAGVPVADSGPWAKPYKHLERMAAEFGFSQKLTIHTRNNFPTGAGIASSASGLLALTLAALAAWTGAETREELAAHGFDDVTLARLARLGSGSACRSLLGGFVHWDAGTSPTEQRVEQVFAHGHWDLCDVVVLLADGEKDLSSTAAHRYVWSSPLFAPRLAGLPERKEAMLRAIAQRNLSQLGPLLEQEALDMHAVSMTATPSHCFLSTATMELISWLRHLRHEQNVQAYFTIDAGPNVHIICAPETTPALTTALRTRGVAFVVDRTGSGPTLTVEDKESFHV